jgi:hypothetical protein
MTNARSPECAWTSSWERLVAYFAKDLQPNEEDRLETHVFACDACAALFHAVARIVARAGACARSGSLLFALNQSMLDRLKAAGVRVIEARSEHGSLDARFTPGTDLMIGHLPADLRDVDEVDIEFHMAEGVQVEAGVPVDDRAELMICCTLHLSEVSRQGTMSTICRVLASTDKRLVGEYRLSFGPV